MVSVQIETTPALRIKGRTSIFATRGYYQFLNTFSTVYDYDASTDRFLMVRNVSLQLPGADIMVIGNAFELLNRFKK